MTHALTELVSLLNLETVDVDRYRGRVTSESGPTVYGGHVAAQALSAAGRSVSGWGAHSLHAYFLRPGNPALPIVYAVDRIRDGKSFATRVVVASQGDKAIFNLSASFHAPEPGLEHQTDMPKTPPPEQCPTWQEWLRPLADRLPPEVTIDLGRDQALDMRPLEPMDLLAPQPLGMVQRFWIRTSGTLPDDPLMHQCVAVYASDSTLMDAMMRPHGKHFLSPDIRAASLDHAVWLHRPFRMDQWILFHQQSPAAFGARGLALGHFFTEDGVLVASVAQEGMFRVVEPTRHA